MATTLTNTGWQGLTSGRWTTGADRVTDNIGGIVINAGTTANTLSGNDSITGSGGFDNSKAYWKPVYFGVENLGTILMEKGINSISGTAISPETSFNGGPFVFGIYNERGSSITMYGNRNSIAGTASGRADIDINSSVTGFVIAGIYNRGAIKIQNGNNNSITGIGKSTLEVDVDEGKAYMSSGIFNSEGGTIAIGNGNNNSIVGTGGYYNGIYNRGSITIGDGNSNSITGTGEGDGAYGIYNESRYNDSSSFSPPSIIIGNGNSASITGISEGSGGIGIFNQSGSTIKVGNGNNDSITGISEGSGGIGIFNQSGSTIKVGDGNDCLTGMGSIGVLNNGTIDTGAGNDKVIANGGFGGSGSVFLEDGNDYLKGFGSGNFYGGHGKDILELTAGTYEVSRVFLGSGAQVNFTDVITHVTMNTSGFETLMAGNNRYDFSNLSDGQMIAVA
jgi:hypothetical protein